MKGNSILLAIAFVSSVLVAILAISSGSLWVDELGTWFLTRADSIPDWWTRFQSWPDSDSQIPLYHFFMYGWTKVVGTDARAMRASNVGMFVAANLALYWPFRFRPLIAVPLILTSCLSASTWYYLNELRPYIMLYMGTCLMVAASIEIIESKQRPGAVAVMALCIGAVISSGATVIGIAWAGSAFLFVLVYWLAVRKSSFGELVTQNYLTLGIAALCIATLIAHDLRMFALGKLPALLGDSSVLTLIFSFYCNLGLLGVGPGMLDMRANGISALIPFAPIIAFSVVILGFVAIGGLVQIRAILGTRVLGLLIACTVLPVLFILALSLVSHWRALPRHFIPLVPLFNILYAFGLLWWWRRRLVGPAISLISVIVMGYSSLSVRYAPRHAKDDYKHAANLAANELARGGRVWWLADFPGALYYGIPLSGEGESPGATYGPAVVYLSDKTPSFLSAQPPPTLVLLSRPESFDRQNLVRNYLSTNEYHLAEVFPAFTAWRR
jgi:hypothetical protein